MQEIVLHQAIHSLNVHVCGFFHFGLVFDNVHYESKSFLVKIVAQKVCG